MMKSNRGFTLIELLVVIAIIGILSSVVLASLNSAREKSRDARRISDIKQLQLALELYFDASSTYPTSLDDLDPTYIPSVPGDPLSTGSNSGAYWYCQQSATAFNLGATLEDTSHSALGSDADQNVSTCAGSGDTFDASDDLSDGIYDIMQ